MKSQIFGRLGRAMEADGFLALGAAETVVGLTDAFKPHADRRGLYRPNALRASPSIVPGMVQPLKAVASPAR